MAASAYPPFSNASMYGMHPGSMADTPRRRRPPNSGSMLLNDSENANLFSSLGAEGVCLAAGVAELLRSQGGRWSKVLRGVICIVKDYQKRAYFLRMVDIAKSDSLWSFPMYRGFSAYIYPPHLITFEGDRDGVIYGLNFSSPREAETFKDHLDKRFEQERRTVEGKSTRGAPPPRPAAVAAPISTIQATPPPPPLSVTRHQPPPGVSPFNANGVTVAYAPSVTKMEEKKSSGGTFFGKKKQDKKKKIRKEDISNPTNFQHKAHVGWDQDTGFSNNADPDPMDETIQAILRAAGQDPAQMSKKTIKFVKNFINNYQSAEEMGIAPAISGPIPSAVPLGATPIRHPPSHSSSGPPPPPPPFRGASHSISSPSPTQWSSTAAVPPVRPPPPPPIGRPPTLARPLPNPPNGRPSEGPPLPPSSHSSIPAPPPPPPLPPVSNSAPPPPPPPPPPPIGSAAPASSGGAPPPPPPTNGRGGLLAEIQAGKQLKSVAEQKKDGSGGEGRDGLLAHIRQGTTLRHVDATENDKRKSAAVGDVGGLAGALARALEERRQQMCDSDEDEESESNKSDWSD